MIIFAFNISNAQVPLNSFGGELSGGKYNGARFCILHSGNKLHRDNGPTFIKTN